MNEIIKELDSAIQEFDKLKHKYPRMKTQDVIDLLRRPKGKIDEVEDSQWPEEPAPVSGQADEWGRAGID